MDDKYFIEKARKFFLETQPNIEQLALLLKEVARDQRYVCAEQILQTENPYLSTSAQYSGFQKAKELLSIKVQNS